MKKILCINCKNVINVPSGFCCSICGNSENFLLLDRYTKETIEWAVNNIESYKSISNTYVYKVPILFTRHKGEYDGIYIIKYFGRCPNYIRDYLKYSDDNYDTLDGRLLLNMGYSFLKKLKKDTIYKGVLVVSSSNNKYKPDEDSVLSVCVNQIEFY